MIRENIQNQKTMKISVYDIIFIVVAVVYYIFCGFFLQNATMIIIAIIAMNVYCIFKCKNNYMLFFMLLFILFSNYSIFAYYWFDLFGFADHNSYVWFLNFPELMENGLYVLYLFITSIVIFLPKKRSYLSNFPEFFYEKNSGKIFVSFIFLITIVIISITTIYTTVATGIYTETTLYEYTTVLYIIALYHSGSNGTIKFSLLLLMFINCMFVFINGDRGAAIQFLIIVYSCFLMHRFSKKTIIIFWIVSIVGLNAIGMWRNSFQFETKMFGDSLEYLISRGGTLNTAYAAEAAGLAILKLRYDYDFLERIFLLCKYVLSIFVGSAIMSSDVDLSTLAKFAYPYHGGGGVLPNYGFFYLGSVGVILLAIIVCLYFRMIANVDETSSGLQKCISLYVMATITRWYLYSPAPLLRGVFLLSVIYYLTNMVIIRKTRKIGNNEC